MLEAFSRLFRGPAFNREDNIARGFLTDNLNNSCPIKHTLGASAAHRCAGYPPPFGIRVLDRYVFCMEMHQPPGNAIQPFLDIMAA
jgi:hypothetical protein